MRALLLIIFLFFGLIAKPQHDLVVLDKDTINCTIIENALDWVSYVLGGITYHVKEDSITISDGSNTGTIPALLKIKHIRFQGNPHSQFSTQDLMSKLDFSANGPHNKWERDNVSNSLYISGIDTAFNKLYWFGLDFSCVKIQLGTAKRVDYSHSFFQDCNDFFLTDRNFKDFINCFNFIVDTGFVTNKNICVSLGNAYNRKSKTLSIDSIRNILQSFPSKLEGVGLVIFITEVDKAKESETFYVTFFDIKTKTVLLCLKETAPSGGIGMGWHWTNPINEILDKITKGNRWRNRYLIGS